VSAGIIYLTTAHYTVAVDGSDCHAIWTSKWSPRDYETSKANRGAAIGGGKIIRGTADGFLLALDSNDGRLLWAKQIANPKESYFISMPPLVHGDLVYIGLASSEWAAKGCSVHYPSQR
jgi:alcohol dehydrogenase (cytochrome c)